MKEVKLYNIIFPIWLLIFFPPIIFITLAGNFVIDSLVILACVSIFKLAINSEERKSFYKNSIIKVWLFGFLADIIGAAILFILGILGEYFGLSYELVSAIDFDPFSNPLAVMVIVFAMLVSALFIFLYNYKITFRELIKDNSVRFKVALTIAIVTMPWTFLLPTKWFY
jgi:hypothetical protein